MIGDKFSSLYELTPEGLSLFRRIMPGQLDETQLDLSNEELAKPIAGTKAFVVENFDTARGMAEAICASLGNLSPQSVSDREGLWAWLTFVLIDVLFPKTGGVRKIKELHRWYPAAPNDYQKAQRHLVRMPVLLFATLGDDADHLICGKPGTGPEIREQLTSQQDMFSPNFQRACRALYFDEATGTVKKGAGGKDRAGVPRRMAAVRKQLDVTWDMTDLPADRILSLLPAEFDHFKGISTGL